MKIDERCLPYAEEMKTCGYFFVRAKGSVIDAGMFVNKVSFSLWNDVFKDCELGSERE